MITLKEAFANQNNLYQICAEPQISISEIFPGNIFYGHDYILKKYASFSETYALKVIVPHGINLGNSIWEAEIHSPLPVIFAYPSYHEKTYIQLNQKYGANKVIFSSASPFLYAVELLKQYHHPERKGTIFFPAHSTHHVMAQTDWEKLAEYLTSLDEEYQPITVCIYWRDFELERHIPFQRRGMKIVSAGHMFDRSFLFRFYHLCSTHLYAASNEIGSNLFFAIKAGCSYFYIDKFKYFYTAKSDDILKRDFHATPATRLDFLETLFQEPQLCMTEEQMQVVDSYLGVEYFKSPEELREQLIYAENLFLNIEKTKQVFTIENIRKQVLFKVLIDGVCFQLYQNSISRIWKALIKEWVEDGFAKQITVIDRAESAPKIPGVKYISLPYYNYNTPDTEREILQQICDQEGTNIFVSTYHTTPITTPSVFIAYDMNPELMGWDLNHPMWREKHHAIKNALAYISFSQNTAQDLVRFFPHISLKSVTTVGNGIDRKTFAVANQEEIHNFKSKYGISKPYFLVVAGNKGYHNNILFFQSFAQLASKEGFDIICTGSNLTLSSELRKCTSGNVVHMLELDDEELATAYSGAIALVYLSNHESFTLPVLEAIACGCPVITGKNPAIMEFAEEAVIYVNDDDVDGMIAALCDVQKPTVRRSLITLGLKQAKKFSYSQMANQISSVLIDASLLPLKLREINYIIFPDWSQPEENIGLELQRVIKALATHSANDRTTLLINTSDIQVEDADIFLSSVVINLMMEEELDIVEALEISLVGDLAKIQWQALLPRIHGRIILQNENSNTIAQLGKGTIPSFELNNI